MSVRIHRLICRAAARSLQALVSQEPFSLKPLAGVSQASSCDPENANFSQARIIGRGWPFRGCRPYSSLEAEAEPRQAIYYVEVITGDVRGAGTPAPAAITLFGEGQWKHCLLMHDSVEHCSLFASTSWFKYIFQYL